MANTCQTKKNRALYHTCVPRYFAAKVHTFFKKRVILLVPTEDMRIRQEAVKKSGGIRTRAGIDVELDKQNEAGQSH
jgi:hypothetical protein